MLTVCIKPSIPDGFGGWGGSEVEVVEVVELVETDETDETDETTKPAGKQSTHCSLQVLSGAVTWGE